MSTVTIGKNRLEAFSDGVLAIIITIMVLELKVPHGDTFAAIQGLVPIFVSYVLSFIYVAIYWNNHHHMIHTCRSVNGAILWANMHLLFWLSLVPFSTGWMGENHFTALPTALYGVNLLAAALAYYVLQLTIVAAQKDNPVLKQALGSDWKGKISPILYLIAIPIAFQFPLMAMTLYSFVALLWIVPDKRIERMYAK